MIDSTNPRCLADNIRHLSGASGSQASDISGLQTAVGTLQTTVGTQGNAIGALQIYDDEETDTGKKWKDGSSIYRKVFTISELIEGSASVALGIDNLDTIISLEGVCKATNNYYAIGYYNGSNSRVTCFIAGSSIVLTIGSTFASAFTECNIVLEYTKSAPAPEPEPGPEAQTSPSPEDETRSAHDPEISDPIERSEEPSDEIIEEPIVETKTTRKRSTSTK